MENELNNIVNIVSKHGEVTSEARQIFASCYGMSLRSFNDACDKGMDIFYNKQEVTNKE